jgi:cardiolipin synthase
MIDDGAAAPFSRPLEALLGIPTTDGNAVDVLRNGDEAFAVMLGAVEASTATIDVQTFAHWSGEIGRRLTAALVGRAAGGVRVRVLLDHLGRQGMDRDLLASVEAAGADVQWFRPLTNWRVTQSTHRGHRKTLVCDGTVAFTGGVGFADHWQGDARTAQEWRDTAVRVRGPAVNGLRAAFADNWAETGRPLFDEARERLPLQPRCGEVRAQVVRGDAETGWGDLSTLVRALVGRARRQIRISAAYFVPDHDAVELMAKAVQRGVAVELLRPGPASGSVSSQVASRAQYARLLAAGVRVFEYQPAVLNAKVLTVDGAVGVVGALNFNARSLTADEDVCVVIHDASVVAVLDAHLDQDLGQAQPVGEWPPAAAGRVERVRGRALGYLARHL